MFSFRFRQVKQLGQWNLSIDRVTDALDDFKIRSVQNEMRNELRWIEAVNKG